MNPNLVRIALPVPLMRYFDYLVPDNLSGKLARGVRVAVPFGRQTKIGVVVECPESSDIPANKLKPIQAVLDDQPLFDDEMWTLLQWAADYYHAPFGEVLSSALPVKLRQGEPAETKGESYFEVSEAGKRAEQTGELKRAKKQAELLAKAVKIGEKFVRLESTSSWRTLLEKGFIIETNPPEQGLSWWQKAENSPLVKDSNRLRLNREQTIVVSRLNAQVELHRGFAAFLLHGVTGSGKTEVYLQLIEATLKQRKQVLVLVPEIGLTPQTIARFKARFNVAIDVLHSNLNDSERLNAWLRAKNGETAIVIGTRSALFTPFDNLGAIIIDEEHDGSFKQQEGWRYHARDLALVRAKKLNIPMVMGSATPSLESLQNVQSGKFIELTLKNRAGNAQFSRQQLIDLRHQPIQSGLSAKLLLMMKQHLEQGNQVMLFLNRRGFAPVLLCHECGWICQCEACEKPFTYHQKQRILRCHHCATQKVIPRQCGHCGSTNLLTTGVGTEQLEKVLAEQFPAYQISRIDRDSTAKKGALDQHLNDIRQGKSQILIGTQMLAKGHHFPNVTLVAIVNVDSSLFSTDFRAEERLAQLYLQVAGRAGRAEKQGEVVLQTHYPDHPLLKSLLEQGYSAFAEESLSMRKRLQLPPFSYQAQFKATAKTNEQAVKMLQIFADFLQAKARELNLPEVKMLSPFPATMAKKAGYFRWVLLIQTPTRTALQKLLQSFDLEREQLELPSQVKWTLDVDPQEVG